MKKILFSTILLFATTLSSSAEVVDVFTQIDKKREKTQQNQITSPDNKKTEGYWIYKDSDKSGFERIMRKRTPRMDREITRAVFMPKGQWIVGAFFSYSQHSNDNYKFLVMEDWSGEGYTLKAAPFFAYTIKDNMSIGARFAYSRNLLKINNLSLNISDDLSFDIKDLYRVQHMYYGSALMRNYISLGDSRIFGLFNEVSLTLGGGQGKYITGKGNELEGTYEDIFEFNVGITPGVIAFIDDMAAIEVSIGVLGFTYKDIKQTTNQVYVGSRKTSSGNFKIDIFSISIGFNIYL